MSPEVTDPSNSLSEHCICENEYFGEFCQFKGSHLIALNPEQNVGILNLKKEEPIFLKIDGQKKTTLKYRIKSLSVDRPEISNQSGSGDLFLCVVFRSKQKSPEQTVRLKKMEGVINLGDASRGIWLQLQICNQRDGKNQSSTKLDDFSNSESKEIKMREMEIELRALDVAFFSQDQTSKQNQNPKETI